MLQDFLTGRPGTSAEDSAPAFARGSAGFQPLNPSRLGQLAPPEEEPARVPEAPRLESPQVEVIEDNGTVRRIVVTCRCCERIEIDCEY